MASYRYQVLSQSGATITGVMEADSPEKARDKLMSMGYVPLSVSEGGRSLSTRMKDLEIALTSVSLKDIILFTKQLRTMVKAGLSLLEILRILEDQTENKRLKRICGQMGVDIRRGTTLYEAFSVHPKVFSLLYCNMILAGEQTGSLPEVLDRLVYLIEHEHKVKSDIRSALQYPLTVLVVLGMAFYVLLTFVIPKFVDIFKRVKIDMPVPTLIAMRLYEFFAAYGYFLLVAVIGLVFLTLKILKTRRGRLAWDRFWLRVPIFGPLFTKAAMARFASIFAILQSSGVSVLSALDVLQGTIGNAAISREFARIQDLLKEGRGLSSPLRQAKHFTPMVVNMVAVGEETGNLNEMLMAVANHYDDEVEYAVSTLSAAINPILVLGLAAVVGFFALAIFLPMWDLTKMAK